MGKNKTAETSRRLPERPPETPPARKRDSLVVLKHVSKRFGGNYALRDINLELQKGEVHCLCGANGCGKSTLAKIISGAHRPDSGASIEIGDNRYDELTPQESRRYGVQVIYQDLALFPNLSVYENIAFEYNLGHTRLYRRERLRRKAREVLDELAFSINLDERVENLSIAQRQQVAICRALVAEAKMVIMDEPTASLTRVEVNHLLDTVRYLKSKDITVVFVNHRLNEVMEVSDRVTVMRDGVLVGTYPAKDMDEERLSELITGRKIDFTLKGEAWATGKVVLEVKDLSRAGQYQDVSFSLQEGEILGVCGLLGSGRTELALSLFGLTRPDHGEIRVDGRPVTLRNHRQAIQAGISYLSEDRLSLGLILKQSVADNMVLTIMERLKNCLGLLSREKRRQTVAEWVKRLDVKVNDSEEPITTLSGGNQQKVVLAKWILTNPKILILDSPTVGVDVGAKSSIYQLIHQLAREHIAMVLISDEVPEVYYNCDRILHFRQGRVAGEYRPDSIGIDTLSEVIGNG
ncbi:MAG: sugar ABC transporter ATP-binding protein [Planctomycetota bacterium]|jgi:simple sugar transport system ATP-binding protein|nr:sugar ABC transporter ATP-binding protein [Planctomycetota bacterium]